jgi:uncharacterized membrane protein
MYHNKLYFYLLLIILCWTLNPFIKKKVLKNNKINSDEYFAINHTFVTIIILVYLYFLFTNKKCDYNCFKKLNIYDYLYIFVGSITSILGARLLLTLIQFKEVSYLVSSIQPLVISLTLIVGYLFFNENISLLKLLGITLIISGLICINKK